MSTDYGIYSRPLATPWPAFLRFESAHRGEFATAARRLLRYHTRSAYHARLEVRRRMRAGTIDPQTAEQILPAIGDLETARLTRGAAVAGSDGSDWARVIDARGVETGHRRQRHGVHPGAL